MHKLPHHGHIILVFIFALGHVFLQGVHAIPLYPLSKTQFRSYFCGVMYHITPATKFVQCDYTKRHHN